MKRKTPHWASVFLLCLIAFSYSCKDDTVSTGGYDPSKPVVFRDFSPEEGSIRTKFYIYGETLAPISLKFMSRLEDKLRIRLGVVEPKFTVWCLGGHLMV